MRGELGRSGVSMWRGRSRPATDATIINVVVYCHSIDGFWSCDLDIIELDARIITQVSIISGVLSWWVMTTVAGLANCSDVWSVLANDNRLDPERRLTTLFLTMMSRSRLAICLQITEVRQSEQAHKGPAHHALRRRPKLQLTETPLNCFSWNVSLLDYFQIFVVLRVA